MKYCLILLTLILTLISCKTNKVAPAVEVKEAIAELEKPSGLDGNLLYNRTWTHAREESTDGNALYLNAEGNTFPPSRYRNSFEFSENGNCRFLYLSPTDRHTMIDGKYNIQDKTLTIYTIDGTVYKIFSLLELDGERLLLKPKTIEE